MTVRVLIYAPKWRENAAGIKVLYLLCDLLNLNGVHAEIVPISIRKGKKIRDLKINYISETWKERKNHSNSNTYVIYSETILGNPLKSTNVIRYYMKYPGLLTEKLCTQVSEVALPYSQNIYNDLEAKKYLNILQPVFISTIDLSEIQFSEVKEEFVAVYASKYRRLYGSPFLQIGDLPKVEIYGRGIRKQSRKETLSIISRSKALISFENSAIVTEAILSRTPVFLADNELTRNPIASFELGEDAVRPISEFGKFQFEEKEFTEAQRKFQDSICKSHDQILRLVEYMETSHFFDKNGGNLKIRHRYIRVAIHKALFFRVYLRRVLRRLQNANN